jgi:Flp pilus assembly protein TadD
MMVAAQKAEEEDRLQDAAVFLAKAYDREPENAEIAWRYGRILRMNNRGDKAVILLTPYSVRSNPSEDILREYAASLLSDGKIQTAEFVITELFEGEPKDPAVWNIAGVVADAGGDTEKAIERFEKGLEYVAKGDERQRSILLNNMALAKTKAGKGDAAKLDISKAMTGAQYYPQIRKNYDAISYFSAEDINPSMANEIGAPTPIIETETVGADVTKAEHPLPSKKPVK